MLNLFKPRTALLRRSKQIGRAVIVCLMGAMSSYGALPDLSIYLPAANPHVVYRTFDPNDCTVLEGCVDAGTRRLLMFTSQTRNVGAADLVLGDPSTNSLFVYYACHNHYHYQGFAEYRLRDMNSNLVVRGHKLGFCVEDVTRWDASASQNTRYDCNYQGIQRGWADVYSEDVPCQWLDITGLPGGTYILEMEVNPDHSLAESSYDNNLVQMEVTFDSDCTPALSNDNFGGAQQIQASPFSFETYNACATKENGEPNHAGNPGGHSIWYVGTAIATGPIRLSTEGSDFDTLLAVYTGTSVDNLVLVGSNNNINSTNHQSGLTFNGVAGTVYYIAVDGYNGTFGKAVLNINPPTNDAFAACQVLTGTRGRTTGYNIGATKQPGEPDHNGSFSWRSVWYCWTAPANGPVVFDTIGSDFDTLLGIYTGSNVGALTRITSDNDSGGNLASRATFNAVAGTTYRIAVDGVQGTSGNLALNWYPACQLRLRKLSASSMELTVSGGSGNYQLQGSADMNSWTSLTNLTMSGASQIYTDTKAGTFARRFYRAVLVQ